MSGETLSIKDRLTDRGLIDQYGFLTFAGGGSLFIVVAKILGVPALLVAIAALCIIIAYAFIVQRSGTGRLRGDQAGDNCYYLGLIYTLASLAYAIFTFDPADTATTIIQGFGVALATTIVGLILRVYFNQSRPDLAESETSARLELAAASGKLKTELSRSVVSMNDFSRQTRQSLEELREEVIVSIQRTREAAETAVQESAREATASVSDHADAAVARTKKVSTATDKVIGGMERHADSLEGWAASHEIISNSLRSIETAATTSQTVLEHLVGQSDRIAELHAASAERANDLKSATTALHGQIEGLARATSALEASLSERIEAVQGIPQSVATSAINGIEAAIERIRGDLSSIVETQSQTVADLAAQARNGAETAARHNGALEAELAKSRDNVAKVHSALVAMTGELAARAEVQSR